MIIGYDAKRLVQNATGLGSYSRTLVRDIFSIKKPQDQMLLYAPSRGQERFLKSIPVDEGVRLSLMPSGGGLMSVLPRGIRAALWRSGTMVGDLKKDGVEIYHGLSGELPWGIKKSGIRTLLTVHDLIFLRHREFYNPIDVLLYTAKFRQSVRQADHIVAISECTKRDILHFSDVDESRISVVYQSCSQRFQLPTSGDETEAVKRKYHLPEKFILSVGTIERRKNTALIVKALRHLPQDMHLVLVGRHTKYTDSVLRLAKSLGVDGRLHIFHGITNDELPAFYALARVFCYPSLYEGFGIPIIEAMQMRLPVVAATGSCLEEAGGEGGVYVSPTDERALAEALMRLSGASPEREKRIELGTRYIRRFENTGAAEKIYSIYESLLK